MRQIGSHQRLTKIQIHYGNEERKKIFQCVHKVNALIKSETVFFVLSGISYLFLDAETHCM